MRKDVTVHWTPAGLEKVVAQQLRARLSRIGAEMRTHIVRKLSEGKTRTDGPSQPGEPPHVNLGLLRQSIFWELLSGGKGVQVGTSIKYGKYLEEGTRRMAARPYLRPSLNEMRGRIESILRTGR